MCKQFMDNEKGNGHQNIMTKTKREENGVSRKSSNGNLWRTINYNLLCFLLFFQSKDHFSIPPSILSLANTYFGFKTIVSIF